MIFVVSRRRQQTDRHIGIPTYCLVQKIGTCGIKYLFVRTQTSRAWNMYKSCADAPGSGECSEALSGGITGGTSSAGSISGFETAHTASTRSILGFCTVLWIYTPIYDTCQVFRGSVLGVRLELATFRGAP